MKIQTDSGYEIDFPFGVDERADAAMTSPYRGDTVAIPFVIRGKPGLLNVLFKVKNVDDKDLDYYLETFTSVLRPGGFWTNFIGRGTQELKGELTVPKRLFPIEIAEVVVENISDRKVAERTGA